MEFDFDPNKSRMNREKHGLDFVEAQNLWLDDSRLVIPARTDDEPRFAIIARWGERIWTGIFTTRGQTIRLISVRRARDEEKELYESATI